MIKTVSKSVIHTYFAFYKSKFCSCSRRLYLIYFNIYLIHLHFSCVLFFFCLKKYLYIKQDSVFLHQKDKYLRKYIILKLDKICLIKLLILQSYAHYKFTKDETDRKLRDNNTYSSSKNKKVIRICIHQFKIFLILNVYSTFYKLISITI